MADSRLRALAFYLPQFHPTPDNDAFWEPGFTEWTNVTRAEPQFDGHHQPHRPAHLGFYDLRVPETRQAQADLARAHGIHGFVYYHYWFNGRRLLNRPFDEVLASPAPDFPFCLCWANENWTRRWDGLESEVLVEQVYSADDDLAHARWLARAFSDPRYIRVGGRPLFLVYRASRLPDPLATTTRWREEARRLGVGELYLCRVESFPSEKSDPRALGFDAAVEFQPDWEHLAEPQSVETHRVFDYAASAARMLGKPAVAHRRYPSVTPAWDNTARRRQGATIVHGSTPDLYEQWLAGVVARFTPYSADENFVFINAWNEWAEGNHLEPCQRWGMGYLEATARALTAPSEGGLDSAGRVNWLAAVKPLASPTATSTEPLLTELYRIASETATRGRSAEADALFRLICGLAPSVSPSLAGKACFKRAQLASSVEDARTLLEQCVAWYPEHGEARRQLDALIACTPR
jgi:lipopolysaccharide biosynthesis protein